MYMSQAHKNIWQIYFNTFMDSPLFGKILWKINLKRTLFLSQLYAIIKIYDRKIVVWKSNIGFTWFEYWQLIFPVIVPDEGFEWVHDN